MMPEHSSGAACSSAKPGGQRVRERPRRRRAYSREPAVVVPAREARRDAEVLVAAPAVRAHAARVAQPRDADPLADREACRARTERVDRADDLVAGNDVGPARREVALGEVQVGAADAAHVDPHAQLARARARDRRAPTACRGPASIGPGRCTTHAAHCALLVQHRAEAGDHHDEPDHEVRDRARERRLREIGVVGGAPVAAHGAAGPARAHRARCARRRRRPRRRYSAYALATNSAAPSANSNSRITLS